MKIVTFDPGRAAFYARFDTTRPNEIEMGEVHQIGQGRWMRPCPIHIEEILRDADAVVVEEVSPRPKEGVSSVFTFGLALGAILNAITLCKKHLDTVSPSVWKKSARIPKDGGVDAKKAALAYARELWPGMHEVLRFEKNHGMADAALIARWYLTDGPGRGIPIAESCVMREPRERSAPRVIKARKPKPASEPTLPLEAEPA